jgi:hypothetical protein
MAKTQAKAKNICFDRLLPLDTRRPQRTVMTRSGRERAISLIGKQWVNGSNIRIRFMSGTQAQKSMVERMRTQADVRRGSSRTAVENHVQDRRN